MTCQRCGGADGSTITIVHCNTAIARGALCEPCLAIANEDTAKLREEFDALLEVGVSRERANQLMIAKLDGKRACA